MGEGIDAERQSGGRRRRAAAAPAKALRSRSATPVQRSMSRDARRSTGRRRPTARRAPSKKPRRRSPDAADAASRFAPTAPIRSRSPRCSRASRRTSLASTCSPTPSGAPPTAPQSMDDWMAAWGTPFWQQPVAAWQHMMTGGPVRVLPDERARAAADGAEEARPDRRRYRRLRRAEAGRAIDPMSGGPLLWQALASMHQPAHGRRRERNEEAQDRGRDADARFHAHRTRRPDADDGEAEAAVWLRQERDDGIHWPRGRGAGGRPARGRPRAARFSSSRRWPTSMGLPTPTAAASRASIRLASGQTIGHDECLARELRPQRVVRVEPFEDRRLPRQQVRIRRGECRPVRGRLAHLPLVNQEQERPRDRRVIQGGGALGVGKSPERGRKPIERVPACRGRSRTARPCGRDRHGGTDRSPAWCRGTAP